MAVNVQYTACTVSQEPTTGVQNRVERLRQEVGVQLGNLFLDHFLELEEDQFQLGH